MTNYSRNKKNTNQQIINKNYNFISVRIEDEFINYVLDKAKKFLNTRVFPVNSSKFILAVSGGLDSVVLFDIFYLLSKIYGYKIYVAHFNHKLRGEDSEKDQQFVQSLSSKHKVEFYSGSGNIKTYAAKNNISTELSARTLRYNFFERTSRNLDADFVVTAHHKDDSVETFLINLFRGTGLTGLSGIPPVRKFVKNVRMIRPLLDFSKEELLEYAIKRNLKWREDESNRSSIFTRNRVRNELIPLIKERFSESAIDTISRAAKHINGADEFIQNYVTNNITNIVDDVEPEKVFVNITLLNTYSDFIKGELIHAVLIKYFRLKSINLNSIDRILSLCNSDIGALVELPENIIATKDRSDFLVFTKKAHPLAYKEKIEYPGEYRVGKYKLVLSIINKNQIKFSNDTNTEYFDLSLIPPYLEIRSWEHGDLINPLGMDGTMTVSDLLTNLKVPSYEKSNVIVLTNQVDIMWVCGYRMSNKFKVNSETKKVLKAQLFF